MACDFVMFVCTEVKIQKIVLTFDLQQHIYEEDSRMKPVIVIVIENKIEKKLAAKFLIIFASIVLRH